jgi:hypothetical protein
MGDVGGGVSYQRWQVSEYVVTEVLQLGTLHSVPAVMMVSQRIMPSMCESMIHATRLSCYNADTWPFCDDQP